MNIAQIKLKNKTVLAPLAGITNLPFRLLAKEKGCALVYTEMISANGLVYGTSKTVKMLDSLPEERPLAVQIFGSDPSIVARAAAMAESIGADIFDINFGCSVKKVIKTGAGSALMRDAAKTEAILKAARKAITIPLTIKIRTGWDRSGDQAVSISKIAEDCGVDAVAIHPRTATQGFSGTADWSIIKKLKSQLLIPVIGNGDITDAEAALRMIHETGCDGVMIGRAAIGNPSIFSQTLSLLKGDPLPPFNLQQHFHTMVRYLEASVKYIGEEHACKMMRSRLAWFVKGLPYSSRFRESIKQVSSEKEAKMLIEGYMRDCEEALKKKGL